MPILFLNFVNYKNKIKQTKMRKFMIMDIVLPQNGPFLFKKDKVNYPWKQANNKVNALT